MRSTCETFKPFWPQPLRACAPRHSAVSASGAAISRRGVTLIVPYGAGGGTDITARLLAKDLERACSASR